MAERIPNTEDGSFDSTGNQGEGGTGAFRVDVSGQAASRRARRESEGGGPAHAPREDNADNSGSFDSYHDYYNQAYDDTKAGPDALTSLEPMKTTNFQAVPSDRPRRGNHAKPEVPERVRKSRRMRKILIVVIVLIVALIVGLGVLAWQLVQVNSNAVSQQIQEQGTQQTAESEGTVETNDAQQTAVRTTEVPLLTAVMGMTQDEAIAAIGHGAVVSGTMEVSQEGSSMVSRTTVALTDEPADTRSGTPTVYLGLDAEGRVVMAGYSVATASLGYSTSSFSDAVLNDRIVENTLNEAGMSVELGTVTLPEDRNSYCTYASDGSLVEENCTFSGETDVNGAHYAWEAVLMYNYTAANASGNLADTIRQVYVYLYAR